MKLMEPCNFHVIDEPLDAIDVIRERSMSGEVDEEPLYICNISDIIEKHRIWKQSMPRVLPFYGRFIKAHPVCNEKHSFRCFTFEYQLTQFIQINQLICCYENGIQLKLEKYFNN